VAFAPVGNPRYACAVVVEHGVGGASTAAPVARDVLIECQKRDPSATPPKSQVASLSPQQQPPVTTPGSH
jgi:penicillin-binding protein 2